MTDTFEKHSQLQEGISFLTVDVETLAEPDLRAAAIEQLTFLRRNSLMLIASGRRAKLKAAKDKLEEIAHRYSENN